MGFIVRDDIQIFSKQPYNFDTYLICLDNSEQESGILGLNNTPDNILNESFLQSGNID